VRAQTHVHDTLLAVRARIVGGPQIVIGNVVEKIAHGRLVDEAALVFALTAIGRLVDELTPALARRRLQAGHVSMNSSMNKELIDARASR
jgi:hypothetical protein